MKVIKLIGALALFSSLFMANGCSSYQDYLRRTYNYGAITGIKDGNIIIDIGSAERIRIGELIDLYKIIEAVPRSPHHYKKIIMGMAQITDILNDHEARAKIIFGGADRDCRAAL